MTHRGSYCEKFVYSDEFSCIPSERYCPELNVHFLTCSIHDEFGEGNVKGKNYYGSMDGTLNVRSLKAICSKVF